MKELPKLKKCPFCNSQAEIIKVNDDIEPWNDWKIRCTGCGIEQGTHKGQDWAPGKGYFRIEDGELSAIIDWNTRYCSE